MGKKINEDAMAIHRMIKSGMKQALIAKLLGLRRQKVNYWSKKDPTAGIKRKKKFSQFFVDKIVRLAKNKPTSSMSCRKIANIINSALIKKRIKSKGKQMKISFKTVSNYLKEIYGKPIKVRKVFFLSEDNKKSRVNFCQNIIQRFKEGKEIMFTDECRFYLGAYTRDWIRLDSDAKNKLKKGDTKVYDLINRPIRKYEPSIMVAGGISYYGTTNIIFVEGNMNDFAYGQTLLFYKEDIDGINEKNNVI